MKPIVNSRAMIAGDGRIRMDRWGGKAGFEPQFTDQGSFLCPFKIT